MVLVPCDASITGSAANASRLELYGKHSMPDDPQAPAVEPNASTVLPLAVVPNTQDARSSLQTR